MTKFLKQLWSEESGQDIAEYAVMLAVILVIVVGNDSLDRIEREHRVLASRQRDSVVATIPFSVILTL